MMDRVVVRVISLPINFGQLYSEIVFLKLLMHFIKVGLFGSFPLDKRSPSNIYKNYSGHKNYLVIYDQKTAHQFIGIQLIVNKQSTNLIHTMFESTHSPNKTLSTYTNTQEKQAQLVMEQFSREIKSLQLQLASELNFNTFLVNKATQLPKIDNKIPFPLPSFDFFCKEDLNFKQTQIMVKKQNIQHQGQIDNRYGSEKSMKSEEQLTEKQEMKQVIKSQSRSVIKIEDDQSFSEQTMHEKNETKNIPKNYGKAMLSFIQKNIQKYVHIVKPILQKGKLRVSDLLNHIKKHKKEVNSIHYLKVMWGFENINDPIFKCIRILSHIFMRKYCLSYIFNSRVKNYNTHIKYRKRMIEGIQNPASFDCIKQF